MHNGSIAAVLLTVALCLASCGSDENVTAPDDGDILRDRPPIPEPTYYSGPVPEKSIELVVATVELSNFVAATDSVKTAYSCCPSGCDLKCTFYPTCLAWDRIRLVDADTIVTHEDSLQLLVWYAPSSSGLFSCAPLSSRPYIRHVRYWVRLGDVERYSGSTSMTVTRSTTRGVERTEAEEFGMSIGMEATASGGFFVDFSVTLRTEFSYSSSTSLTVSEEETVEESFTITCPDNKNIVYCVWQLVDEFRIIGADGLPFSDPKYNFIESSLGSTCPQSEFVPMTTYFDNP